MTERTKNRLLLAVLGGCLILTALLDDPELYNPQPGPNAPVYFNYRTGEWVDPRG